MFLASPLCPTILVRHMFFGFSADELSAVSQCSSLVPRLLMSWNMPSLVFVSIFVCFSVASGLTAVIVILFVSGVLVVWWLRYVMMLWLYISRFSFCVVIACPGRFSGVNQRLGIG